MKKLSFLMIAVLIFSVVAIVIVSSEKALSQKKPKAVAAPIPENVASILKHSCASCHDAGGNHMAESVWSLSKWDGYKASKQASKANSMCKMVTKGKMPPASAGPEKVPTAEQKDALCKWAASLQVE